MSYTPVPAFLTGDTIDEAFLNTYWRDNMAASVPDMFSAKGQLAVGLGVDDMGILNVGVDGAVLTADSSQALGVKWADAGAMYFIDEETLGADVASVTFANIPNIYRDLILKYYARIDSSTSIRDYLHVRFNGDSGNNYDYNSSALVSTSLLGTVLTLQSSARVASVTNNTCDANSFGAGRVEISNYADRAGFLLTYGYGGQYHTSTTFANIFTTGQWRSSAPVDTMYILGNGGNLRSGSKFALYGIK